MDSIIIERPEITIDDEEPVHSAPGHVGQRDVLTPENETPPRRAGKNRSKLLVGVSFSVVALAAIGVFAISPYSPFSMADAGRAVSHAGYVAMQGVPGLSAPQPMAPAARLARARLRRLGRHRQPLRLRREAPHQRPALFRRLCEAARLA